MNVPQIETLNEIDDKGSDTARLVAIPIGLLLSAGSFVTTRDALVSDGTGVATLLLVVAGAALLGSLMMAIVTYLSSRFASGPSAHAAEYLLGDDRPDEEYRALMCGDTATRFERTGGRSRPMLAASSARSRVCSSGWCLCSAVASSWSPPEISRAIRCGPSWS